MIILHACGQTGNKFFTYSNYIADSLESGEAIIILSPDLTTPDYPNLQSSNILKFPFYYECLANIIGHSRYIRILYFVMGNKYTLKILSALFKLFPNINFIIAVTGSHKSPNRLKYNNELKQLFTPRPIIISEVESYFIAIREKYRIICGIHIRYGDYASWRGGKFYYSEKQYHNIMLGFKDLFPNASVAFFISSNEKIDLGIFNNCECFSLPHNQTPTRDLYGLSISDYIIGPPSTFSGWASYFGNVPLYFIESPEEEISLSSFKCISEIWD